VDAENWYDCLSSFVMLCEEVKSQESAVRTLAAELANLVSGTSYATFKFSELNWPHKSRYSRWLFVLQE
jgi:hypothetical protein